MRILVAIVGLLACLTWPNGAQAQSILESTDASRLNALIRANLCEKSCRYGNLNAKRYKSDEIKTANRFKLYVVTASGRSCTNRGCADAFMAINNRSVIRLAEGVEINLANAQIPAEVGTRPVAQATGPRNGVACAAPGRQMNSALLKQTFLGKTMHGFTAKGARWSETIQENGRTRFVNASGKVSIGRHIISKNHICFKYRAGQDFRCKAVYECNSNEGQWVLSNQARKLTSVITHVSAEGGSAPAQPKPAPAPAPTPQAQFDPLKPLVPDAQTGDLVAGLAACRGIRSDLRRLNCYDTLAKSTQGAAPFTQKDRTRLTNLMTFRNASGVTLTQTRLDQCTLTVKVDAPEVKFSFTNVAEINLAKLDLNKSRQIIRGEDGLYSFVAKGRNAWDLKTIDKARGSERASRNVEALLLVTAYSKNLDEVERLIRKLAGECQS